MSSRSSTSGFAKKLLRLVEVQIFFAMSVFGGSDAVLKHTATTSSAAKERTKPATERAVRRTRTLANNLLLVKPYSRSSAIEKGYVRDLRCERIALAPLLSFKGHLAAPHGNDNVTPLRNERPQSIPYNLLQELAPLLI